MSTQVKQEHSPTTLRQEQIEKYWAGDLARKRYSEAAKGNSRKLPTDRGRRRESRSGQRLLCLDRKTARNGA